MFWLVQGKKNGGFIKAVKHKTDTQNIELTFFYIGHSYPSQPGVVPVFLFDNFLLGYKTECQSKLT